MKSRLHNYQDILGGLSETSQTIIAIVFVIIFLLIARYTIKLNRERRTKKRNYISQDIPLSKMLNYKKFNTAEGFCYIMETHLVITDHSDPKEILRRKESDPMIGVRRAMQFSLVFYIGIMTYFYFIGLNQSMLTTAIVPVFIILLIARSRNRSRINIIPRDKIMGINLTRYLFNPAILIHFRDKSGKIKNRYIQMKKSNPDDIAEGIRLLSISGLMNLQKGKQILNTLHQKFPNETNPKNHPQKNEYTSKSKESYKRNTDGYLKDY